MATVGFLSLLQFVGLATAYRQIWLVNFSVISWISSSNGSCHRHLDSRTLHNKLQRTKFTCRNLFVINKQTKRLRNFKTNWRKVDFCWNPVRVAYSPHGGRWASRVGGEGETFSRGLRRCRGENIVVARSKRKWRVSLRNSTKKYKNRHLFFFYFSAVAILLFCLLFPFRWLRNFFLLFGKCLDSLIKQLFQTWLFFVTLFFKHNNVGDDQKSKGYFLSSAHQVQWGVPRGCWPPLPNAKKRFTPRLFNSNHITHKTKLKILFFFLF